MIIYRPIDDMKIYQFPEIHKKLCHSHIYLVLSIMHSHAHYRDIIDKSRAE